MFREVVQATAPTHACNFATAFPNGLQPALHERRAVVLLPMVVLLRSCDHDYDVNYDHHRNSKTTMVTATTTTSHTPMGTPVQVPPTLNPINMSPPELSAPTSSAAPGTRRARPGTCQMHSSQLPAAACCPARRASSEFQASFA